MNAKTFLLLRYCYYNIEKKKIISREIKDIIFLDASIYISIQFKHNQKIRSDADPHIFESGPELSTGQAVLVSCPVGQDAFFYFCSVLPPARTKVGNRTGQDKKCSSELSTGQAVLVS